MLVRHSDANRYPIFLPNNMQNALRSVILARDAEEENGGEETGVEDGAEGEKGGKGGEEEEEEGVERDRRKLKQARKGEWTYEEHEMFLHALREHGKDWENVAKVVRTRSVNQVRTHAQKFYAAVEVGKPFPAKPYPRQGGGGMLKVRY